MNQESEVAVAMTATLNPDDAELLQQVADLRHGADQALTLLVITANKLADSLQGQNIPDAEFRSLASAALTARRTLREVE